MRRGRRLLPFVMIVLGMGVARVPAGAAVCPVPSPAYPTLGAALRDAGCSTIELAAGVFPENVEIGRDVLVHGAGSTATAVAGRVAVAGATADVTLAALTIDATATGVAGCWEAALLVQGGAELASGPDLRVLQTTQPGDDCRLFADGFESGGVLAWSLAVP